MKIFAFAAAGLAAIALVLYGIWPSDGTRPPGVLNKLKLTEGRPAVPETVFVDADGKTVTLADFKGRTVLVNVWATWCGPCILELPSLARLSAKMPKDRFAVVAVDSEKSDPAKVHDFFARHDADGLGIYIDATLAATQALKANELPLTVLIDAQGHEIARASGDEKWDDPAAVAYLTKVSEPAP